jgi:hypothetical protein
MCVKQITSLRKEHLKCMASGSESKTLTGRKTWFVFNDPPIEWKSLSFITSKYTEAFMFKEHEDLSGEQIFPCNYEYIRDPSSEHDPVTPVKLGYSLEPNGYGRLELSEYFYFQDKDIWLSTDLSFRIKDHKINALELEKLDSISLYYQWKKDFLWNFFPEAERKQVYLELFSEFTSYEYNNHERLNEIWTKGWLKTAGTDFMNHETMKGLQSAAYQVLELHRQMLGLESKLKVEISGENLKIPGKLAEERNSALLSYFQRRTITLNSLKEKRKAATCRKHLVFDQITFQLPLILRW